MELTTDEALQQGIAAHRAGKLEDAEKLYKAILVAHPKHPDANHNLGILAVGVGKLDESVPYFKTALEASPNVEQFWLSYIDTLIKLGHLDGARQVIQQGRGVGLKGTKIDGLEARLGNSLPSSSDPSKDQLDGFVSLYQQGKYEEALVRGKALSEQFPGNAFIPNILGAVHAALGDNDAAVSSYNKAIEIKPDYAEPYNNLGVSLKTLGRHTEAITSYNKAIEIQPDYAEAYNNLGNSLNDVERHNEAVASYNKAIEIQPNYVDAHYNLGISLNDLERYNEAIASYNKAIQIQPDHVQVYNNRGITFFSIGMQKEAMVCYRKAILLAPFYAEAYYNIGRAFQTSEKFLKSRFYFDLALRLDRTLPKLGLSITLQALGLFDEAIDILVLELN